MGWGKWPDTQSAASRPRAIASATEETPNRHMTESVSPYTTWEGSRVTERPLSSPRRARARGAFWPAGRVAPDLGSGAVAVLQRVLGLHQLLRFLNHLAPEPSDTLWEREPRGEGLGAGCRGRGARGPTATASWRRGLGWPFCPFGPQRPNPRHGGPRGYLTARWKEWVPGTEEVTAAEQSGERQGTLSGDIAGSSSRCQTTEIRGPFPASRQCHPHPWATGNDATH